MGRLSRCVLGICDLFEGKMRGRAMGTFQMLVTLGTVVGPVVGGFVGEWVGFHGVFWVLAATGLLMWFANYRILPETKPETSKEKHFSPRDFVQVLADPTGSAVVMLGFIQYYTMYNFLVFLPHLLSVYYGLSASEKGLMFLPLSACLVMGSYLGGRLQEKADSRNFLLTTATLNVLSTVLFIFLAPISLPLLLISIALFGLCLGLSLPVQTTLLADVFQSNRATAIGVYNFSRYIGMAVGPIIGTPLFKLGNRSEFFFAALLFAVAVCFALRQFRRAKKEQPV